MFTAIEIIVLVFLSVAVLNALIAVLNEGSTVIYIAIENRLAGYIVLSDTLRREASDMIQNTESLGITPVLLTGDHENAASFIAGKLGIRDVTANCLPEDKLSAIASMQQNGDSVCMPIVTQSAVLSLCRGYPLL